MIEDAFVVLSKEAVELVVIAMFFVLATLVGLLIWQAMELVKKSVRLEREREQFEIQFKVMDDAYKHLSSAYLVENQSALLYSALVNAAGDHEQLKATIREIFEEEVRGEWGFLIQAERGIELLRVHSAGFEGFGDEHVLGIEIEGGLVSFSFENQPDDPAFLHLMEMASISYSVLHLRLQTLTDRRTGLYSHAFFEDELERNVADANRHHHELSLIFIDLDNFRNLNKRFGHLAADAALAELGEIIVLQLRQTDIAARWGGDEFAVLLPETKEADACEVAERIRQAVERHQFGGKEEGKSFHLTLSVGVASYPWGMAPGDFQELADRAMYRSKRVKNRITVASKIIGQNRNG